MDTISRMSNNRSRNAREANKYHNSITRCQQNHTNGSVELTQALLAILCLSMSLVAETIVTFDNKVMEGSLFRLVTDHLA